MRRSKPKAVPHGASLQEVPLHQPSHVEAAGTKPTGETTLTLINHASVLVSTPHALLLSDPWTDGSAFNDGWDLLVPSAIPDLSDDSRPIFVWYSHEHPDHFSARWLRELDNDLKRRVTVLFQRTKDQRVASFCRANGFEVAELDDQVSYRLAADLVVTCGFVWEYNSWLFAEAPGLRLLNLNDCRFTDDDLRDLAERLGEVDVVATQFSYAAWKGGPGQTELRREYAEGKLRQMAAQIDAIRPTWVVPFASFIYFSHVENAFMNDAVNTVDEAVAAIEASDAKPLVLFPGDYWTAGGSHDPAPAILKWRAAFGNTDRQVRSSVSSSEEVLRRSSLAYCKRLGKSNNRLFLALLRWLPVGGFLRPIEVGLFDCPGRTWKFSSWKGLYVSTNPADVMMHSSSLELIFAEDFGFDTLLVNGRFDAESKGFSKLSRAFGITIINTTGRSISWRGLKDFRYFLDMLATQRKFSGNAERSEARGDQ